jgi:hypothetical protein
MKRTAYGWPQIHALGYIDDPPDLERRGIDGELLGLIQDTTLGSRCHLWLRDDLILDAPEVSQWRLTVDEVVAVEIGGPGVTSTGGGFVGGGFGVKALPRASWLPQS